ncbi:GNAT family N-acetyltransferase [Candidatus Woesearchaeota archaeon]|nr:GNAT family N-acetyltransferase [Candidatus Woesearchaeota archaeon]MBW3005714.1 GNAT family N-acetyltransferase [Candidatus Woesearchaeota archaeon]
MRIREHTEQDFSMLVELMQKADNRPKEWAISRARSHQNNAHKTILIAEEDGCVLGYVGIRESETNAETEVILGSQLDHLACLTWIAVHPDFRRRGIATELLKNCGSWASEKDKKGIWLDCRKKLVPFYENAGYVVAGSYSDKGSERYVLVKQ